ncbi:MAG: UDP-N-acetylmuramoyl-L-alanine--D-glutamate ligase [Planctomycetota bacterium]|nr:UDP-N-acetylmuramoyl-L-alanine--D-glutamate ligase [Planctomycetota bacterium]
MTALAGRRVLVMGLGRFGGGLGATRHLLAAGAAVTVTDLAAPETLDASLAELSDEQRAAITWRLGEHRDEDFAAADLVVVNQAVPPGNRYVRLAQGACAETTTELELFLAACPARLALVTGTQGKSSTVTVLAGLARAAGEFRRVHLGGNIGRSLLDDLPDMQPGDLAVVEVSSYQLEHLASRPPRRADVVVVTNLMEDHLERHGTLASYHAAKLRILELLREDGIAILPAGVEPESRQAAHQAGRPSPTAWTHTPEPSHPATLTLGPTAFLHEGTPIAPLAALALPGAFQRPNALCALGAGLALGLEGAAMAAALPTIAGPAYRAEELGHFGPAASRVIDNGVSTTPDSTESVLVGLDAPVALLVGGRSKGLPLGPLVEAGRDRLARVACFGAAADELAAAFRSLPIQVSVHPTVESAVAHAFAHMDPGEVLLFSPACSSFDAFNNFEERVRAFRAALPKV